jgi:hypothetical protein
MIGALETKEIPLREKEIRTPEETKKGKKKRKLINLTASHLIH